MTRTFVLALLVTGCGSEADLPTDSDTAVVAEDSGDSGTSGLAQGLACTSVTELEAGISAEAEECGSGLCGGVVCSGGVISVCLGEPCGGGCEVGESCVGFTNPASSRCLPSEVCDE